MRYALYVGCLILAREPNFELSVREVLPALGVELVDMQGTSCCAPFSIQSLDCISWMAFAARNLCIAEEMGLDVLTLCNDCYESLLSVNRALKGNPKVKDRVNEILSEVGKEFKGVIDVKHPVEVLHEEVGVDKIKDILSEPFKGLKVGTQPGCHLYRPRRLHFGVLGRYGALDELVRATGAEIIDYDQKYWCCGGPLRGINDELARSLLEQKLIGLKKVGVDCVITVCPYCYLMFDSGQLELKRYRKEEYNLPVLHYIELLRLAMGVKLADWEVRLHRTPLGQILKGRLQG